MRSVTKNVMGYGKMPTDISKVYNPNGDHEKNFWKMRFELTKDAMKIPASTKYNFCLKSINSSQDRNNPFLWLEFRSIGSDVTAPQSILLL